MHEQTHNFCKPEIIASHAEGRSSGSLGCSTSLTSALHRRQKRSMLLLAICRAPTGLVAAKPAGAAGQVQAAGVRFKGAYMAASLCQAALPA